MNRVRVLTFIFLLAGILSHAQTNKQTTNTAQVWLAYMNQTRFSDKWGLWADVHLRTKEDFVSGLSTGILRAGLIYYLNDNTRLTAGYAFVNHFPAENHKNISVPEHRPWQQIQWNTKYSKLSTSQYIRLEERFRRKVLNDDDLDDGNMFNYRARYNFLMTVPLRNKPLSRGSWSYFLNDEVHINLGKEIVNNYFDQNRFFTGLAVNTTATNSIQFGYFNVFIQTAAGNRYRNIHALRVNYVHNLDLRRP